jgi:hypothetical protein
VMGWAARSHCGAKARARQAYRERLWAWAILPAAILKQAALLLLALLLLPLRVVGWVVGRTVKLVKGD